MKKSILLKFKILLFLCLTFLAASSSSAQVEVLESSLKTLGNVDELLAQASEKIAKIDAASKYVEDNELYKALIDGKEFSLPIGILPGDADKNYALILNSVQVTPEGMFAEIFMKVQVSSDKHLYFIADKVPFSRAGGIAGELTLYLLRTDSLVMGSGYAVRFDGLEKGGVAKSCYARFSCKGFTELNLTGAVNLSREAVKDSLGGQVSVGFQINARKINDFVLTLNNIPSFEFTNLPGFKVTVPSIVVDQSETNSAGITLPQYYTSLFPGSTGPGWQGIYIPKAAITIPKYLNDTADAKNSAVSINIQDFVVDQNGVSGKAGARNVLNGSIKGWAYSIDSIRFSLTGNSLSAAGMLGEITLPINKSGSNIKQLSYGILMTKNPSDQDLNFSGFARFETGDEKIFQLSAFEGASIELSEATIAFEYKDKQLFPSAILNGAINLKLNGKNSTKTFADIGLTFTKLQVSTKEPYLSILEGGGMGLKGSTSSLANLPVSVLNPGFVITEGGQRVGLNMKVVVHLQEKGNGDGGGNGFDGSAEFTVFAKRNPQTKRWEYDDFVVGTINLNLDQGAFSIKGQLTVFENDEEYGSGFCGSMQLKVINVIEVKASAIFGKKDNLDFRYWFVDAGVVFPAFPVAPFVGINGFMGGLYHHMEMTIDENSGGVSCPTASGLTYVPNKDVYLGLLAGVGLQSLPTAAIFNGNINFGIEFFETGSLKMIALFGKVTLLTGSFNVPGLDKVKESMKIPGKDQLEAEGKTELPDSDIAEKSLTVKWFTQYDFPNKTFIGDFDIFVRYDPVLQGPGKSGKAGHIAVLFSPGAKYVWMGTPLEPISLKVISLVTISSYFVAGNKLPSPPIAPLPPQILNPPKLDPNALEAGSGLAFGARLSAESEVRAGFGFGYKKFSCSAGVSAKVRLDAGFDILLSKSNRPIYCSDSRERGVNNWYATGQAYIYGGFSLSAYYKCGPLKKSGIPIFSAYLSAYLFAQLPNPTYMKGDVSVGFKLLVNVNVTIPVELGEQCGSPPTNDKEIVFISSMLPTDGSEEVKVTEQMYVNFSKPIENFKFLLPDENSKNASKSYRGYVGPGDMVLKIKDGANIPFTMNWNKDRTQVGITPNAILPENTEIMLIATVRVQYESSPNNWVNVEGKIEQDTTTFITDYEPDKILLSNVKYAYPGVDMKAYYKSESNLGYFSLFTLPVKALKEIPGYEFQVVYMNGTEEVARITNLTINRAVNAEQLEYNIPNDRLLPEVTYTVNFIRHPIKDWVKEAPDSIYTSGYITAAPEDIVIMSYNFTTSKFNTFVSKLAYFNQNTTEVAGKVVINKLSTNRLDRGEPFIDEEVTKLKTNGLEVADPLIRPSDVELMSGGVLVYGSKLPKELLLLTNNGGLLVKYEVFAELQRINDDVTLKNVVCAVNNAENTVDCSRNGNQGETGEYKFPKGKYYYKLAYYLPGKNIKTSETSVAFNLDNEIAIVY